MLILVSLNVVPEDRNNEKRKNGHCFYKKFSLMGKSAIESRSGFLVLEGGSGCLRLAMKELKLYDEETG